MSMIRSAIRSSLCLRSLDPVTNRSSLPFLHESRKCLCTVTEQPPPPPSSSPLPPLPEASPVAGLSKPSGEGKYYGKFSGISKHTLKTDILNILEGCNVTQDDLKFSYIRGGGNLIPAAVFVQFPSPSSYDNALRAIMRKGKLHKLERAPRSQWDPIVPYDGKVVALHGLSQNASLDDIVRFLSGCLYNANDIQFISVQGRGGFKRIALVRFASQIQAMNAYITKNRNFLLNERITMQVLQ